MNSRAVIAAAGAAAFLATIPCAGAEPSASPPPSESITQSSDGAAISPAGSWALSDKELDALRGGDGHTTVISNQMLSSVLTGDVINGNYTAGNVTISDSALSNFNGLGNLVINTGAQVSLQSGMNVTINTTP
ncbi:MAG TPA: hypothetical protein VGU01_00850 [Sphingomicrobium sp.]|nr:hypothetical protein [Sphingomicrobium sp.]